MQNNVIIFSKILKCLLFYCSREPVNDTQGFMISYFNSYMSYFSCLNKFCTSLFRNSLPESVNISLTGMFKSWKIVVNPFLTDNFDLDFDGCAYPYLVKTSMHKSMNLKPFLRPKLCISNKSANRNPFLANATM